MLTTTIEVVDDTRRIPRKPKLSVGNSSCTNFEMCPEPGTTTLAVRPVFVPSSDVSSKLTVVDATELFVIAMPLWIAPAVAPLELTSTYVLNARPPGGCVPWLTGDTDKPILST